MWLNKKKRLQGDEGAAARINLKKIGLDGTVQLNRQEREKEVKSRKKKKNLFFLNSNGGAHSSRPATTTTPQSVGV